MKYNQAIAIFLLGSASATDLHRHHHKKDLTSVGSELNTSSHYDGYDASFDSFTLKMKMALNSHSLAQKKAYVKEAHDEVAELAKKALEATKA